VKALLTAWLALAVFTTSHAGEIVLEIRDQTGKPLPEAVAYATAENGTAPKPATLPQGKVDQVNKQFVPQVTIVQTGTSVDFPNSDNIRHSLYSFSPPKVFTQKLYSGKQAPPITFDKPGLVLLGCNIHDQMVAWIVVVDTPYIAKSGADGKAALKSLPTGEYTVQAWYPSPGFEPFSKNIAVAADGVENVAVTLDSTGLPR
jgi:plastocyanin